MQRRWVSLAAVLGASFYLLSLGPALRFLGHATRIPGPAALFYRLPFARFVSAPARFQVIVALSAAVLVSLAVTFLLNRLRLQWTRRVAVAGVCALLLGDLLTVPFPVSSTADPAWSVDARPVAQPMACRLPDALQTGTVITFPLIHWPYSMKSTWMQVTDRGRYKLVDGYLSYSPERIWRDYWANPLLRSLLSIQGEFPEAVDLERNRDAARAALRALHTSAIVIFDSPQRDAAVRYIGELLGQRGAPAGSCTVFAAPGDVEGAARR